MHVLNLNGPWGLQKNGRGKKIPVAVPGDVHADLLAAGEIPDPFHRDNELQLQWIGESDWCYSRTFTVSKNLLSKTHILLRCEGLDTFARVTINGRRIAETDNMFRTYEWDVKEVLKPGRNTIRVDFTSVLPYIRKQQDKFPGWTPLPAVVAYAGWVRKEQCNFGWDWGPKLVTCGIWRDIKIMAFNEARLADVLISQSHSPGRVDLEVDVSLAGAGRGLAAEVSVRDGCEVVATASLKVKRKTARATLSIPSPKLWWPNNMGAQNLYSVEIALKNTDGDTIDAVEKRIGLRTLELDRHEDEWGESFQFVVNGVPCFAKGANWIPVDAVLGRCSPEDYRRLVQDAAAANMNMLRVWGGGIYEDDAFYAACDELGICVWQDFMFACSNYPIFSKAFMKNVKLEARDAIKRLRHHPCMALWCGNNELEMMNVGDGGWKAGQMPWNDYKTLFDDLLPEQVEELSPDIPYWPSSPHTPKGDRVQHRSHLCGDAHLWIMSGREPLECARGFGHRFASEFGFQSFPEPKTVEGFTGEKDRNLASRVMELHQRAPNGNATMVQQFLKCFRMPVGFENTAWLTQILQGAGVKGVCEHFRRNMPRTMGTLYWQLNDCWPVASWASIDYHGRWKALQYMARHFFAPVLLSGVEDRETGTVEIHLTSDRLKALPATVSWTITDVAGAVLAGGAQNVRTPVNGNRKVKTLRLSKLLKRQGAHDVLVWLEAEIQGEPPQRNLVLFAPPKHLELRARPGIRYRVVPNEDGSFFVTLASKQTALWVWVELSGMDAGFSDNFFHLRPGASERIRVSPAKGVTASQLGKRLVIKSLVDTYCSPNSI